MGLSESSGQAAAPHAPLLGATTQSPQATLPGTAATASAAPSPEAATIADRLRASRPELAILLDFDGVISPIVDDPAAAAPDPTAAAAIAELATEVPLVAVVTGRPALTARALLGIDTIAIHGLHGAEVLAPGEATPTSPEAFLADAAAVNAIVDDAIAEPAGLAGLEVERKGPIVALHWRTVADPAAAEQRALELGARAEAAGLRSGLGRAVLELRPATKVTKGDGARALITGAPAVRHALFAGDDVTDLDAFAALRALVSDGVLDSATLVAVAGPDAPPAVAAAADLVLPDPAALGSFLASLLGDGDADPAARADHGPGSTSPAGAQA